MHTIRIGTRDSKLALWQAEKVKGLLEAEGQDCQLVPLKSAGDIDLTTPLNQFGGTGIFTKILDDALLDERIDIAVHSMKDYPTQAPAGIHMAAVLERAESEDILVHKGNLDFNTEGAIIATGSIRRIAQWKSRYPHYQCTNLRGNVQTRLAKLESHPWQGAIFAKAGLSRLGLLPENHIVLDWMIPAPAQGVIAITCLEKDPETQNILSKINHKATALRAKVERDFLRTVEGGCSAPVGAYSEISGEQIHLKAGIFSTDGQKKVTLEKSVTLNEAEQLGSDCALQALSQGGAAIMESLKNEK
jgi:hydroxymethylbilane synthase